MIDIPDDVIDATKTVHVFFAKNGSSKWQLGEVCSRKYAYENEKAHDLLKKLEWLPRGEHDDLECPCCHNWDYKKEHLEGCEMAAMLKELEQ